MNGYVATFHTHAAALMTHRAMSRAKISARMAPVPRALSSSCGTCVFYEAETPMKDLLDEDTEAVYLVRGGSYELLFTAD